MEFSSLCDRMKAASSKYSDARNKAISSACDKLVPMLERLAGYYKEPEVDRLDAEETWINLRYIAALGIRYCGQFVNIISINNDTSLEAINRLGFLYANYESHDDFTSAKIFPDDTYFGEAADERYQKFGVMKDWDNFEKLVKQLGVYYMNSPLSKEYEALKQDILHSPEAKELYAADMDATSVAEDIELFFRDFFRKFNDYNPNCMKHFMLFPENVSVRYRGKFHNCLLIDNYSLSLGYFQRSEAIQEEGYNQDPYTICHDFDRYIDEPFVLLHETSLTRYAENDHEYLRALKCIAFMLGDNLERVEDDAYLSGVSVIYRKTVFTD